MSWSRPHSGSFSKSGSLLESFLIRMPYYFGDLNFVRDPNLENYPNRTRYRNPIEALMDPFKEPLKRDPH